ncbi:UDP-3-O-(3-hydroxymyristoyl)glucosamine N-acyltransferase [Cocleimonas sp. KMM 6892]|uniref:UDP-3-O-(3-hydroxymyristoyl)glucosamine N-acyltransferase n=1 Tax=unclassified Cocleimonas TaxID=2639732 RepID=UPI002DBBC412|nr:MULTISPECIES: UDP-3-O-(3-hydroxymyristoyl)glucosamine N-acyltransferase [unclassified Cocleimonas]MEB8430943.1 UDP-3-O-(3-hydroxymyristoyl)glucosamine N-acyltransferase [Cocleimonas sp. KMM 6892]MEC4714285.1 UDP-3-O-(3-hydroxymyristoyl)glucosamine N-acyltransferase [Cocleimonas sp. KMM 6895]MEC4743616.1 UDP-3-O-(3-hydroxymyristoyl)glucosamine N-acyltransferase [Cocleimonas sp. KMM 6896]
MSNKTDVNILASFLKTKFIGLNYPVKYATSVSNLKNNCISFTSTRFLKNTHAKEFLILAPLDFTLLEDSNYSVIKVANPRLAFAKILTEFFTEKPMRRVHPSTIIGINTFIHETVTIGCNCHIGDNVKIGKDTVINHNVVINDNTQIGKNCYIKSGTTIGEDGFGFAFEENGTPIRIPHLGKVIIGNDVEIGAKNTIARGTLDDTVIDDRVKTDDQVHIAHNCWIGENTIITACSEISGSVTIGKNCWIGPNTTFMQKINIGDNSTIGIGALVLKNVKSDKKVMGLEAIELKKLIKFKKRIQYDNY